MNGYTDMPKKSRKIETEMEEARTLSGGTMPIDIVFATEEEVATALAWMKGKRKVSTLSPITVAQSEKNRKIS